VPFWATEVHFWVTNDPFEQPIAFLWERGHILYSGIYLDVLDQILGARVHIEVSCGSGTQPGLRLYVQ